MSDPGNATTAFQPRQEPHPDAGAEELPAVIDSARLYREAQRRLSELTTVQRVAQAINSTLDLDAIFQTVVTQINTAFGYQMVSIYLREGDGLRLQAYLGYQEVMWFIRLDQGVSGRVARTGLPVFVRDALVDEDFIVILPGTQQAIIVPLKDGDGVVLGTLLVESAGAPVLSDDDFTILTLLADQISVAVVNVRLFAERKRAEEALRRQNAELAALHETTLDLMNRLDQTSLLEAIMTRATALHGTAHGYLYILDPAAQEMVLRIGIGAFSDRVGTRAKRGQGLAGRAWAINRSVQIEDYAVWTGRRWDHDVLHAGIAAPLRVDGDVAGVLGLAHAEVGRLFDASDIALLERFADLASIALDNARLYAAAQQELAERRRMEGEQLALERKLLEAQKAESLGVLAGGIAHDFNNLLQVILGNVDLARAEEAGLQRLHTSLGRIEIAAERAADLTRQLLAYAGKGRFLVERVDLNAIIVDTLSQLQFTIPAHVRLSYMPMADLPTILADAAQIRQVVMNLVVNAAEALENIAGTLSVTTGVEQLHRPTGATADLAQGVPAGDYVYIEVADSGPGMDLATQARMFDPFFTTKFTGRGLGLAAAQGIVRGHQGGLQVYSAPGVGTRVRVWLPYTIESRAAAITLPAPTHPSMPALPQAPAMASATILVIDDEDGVRTVASRMIERSGFAVLAAADGRAGIALFHAHREAIGCVLLDLTMPHMDGEQVFRELRQINPDALIILMSGYTEADATSRFAGHELAGYLHKPFTLSDLRGTIQRVLTAGNKMTR